MPDSNRRVDTVSTIFAIGALVALCVCAVGIVLNEYAKVQEGYASYQRNADDDRREAIEKTAHACKDRELTALRLCIADQFATYSGQQSANQDLQAQQDMAFWSMWMVVASGITILVTGIGVYLVWQTLEETRQAVVDTSRMTKAAEEANAIAADAHRRSARAYLAVIYGDLTIEKGKKARFAASISNYGQTPAREVALVSIAIVADGEPSFEWPDVTREKVRGVMPSNTIHPNEPTMSDAVTTDPISEEDWNLIKTGRKCIYARHMVFYKDVFGEEHVTCTAIEFSGTDCIEMQAHRKSVKGNYAD